MSHKVVFDEPNSLFRVHLEGEHDAIMKFDVQGSVYVITSTKVPEELQGKGYGKVMMEAILPEIERQGVKINPICTYVVHYLSRHPEWSHLLAEPS
ncbi:N-acetyltransferase [Vibrio sp. Isolate25]|uniref:GNAT family N-acetyltransferase n=1 Tax=unclassified Vibrio TaxID=2614977 RepID=UPI001EFEE493|nr:MULTISPECIES: GNAT family N-acetyltransferase [unclassified Vibrio]MCG9596191.1 N-acetyltransferase [Vibrio sp. Isolate25]MCG9676777.1 N-acetyltransferase [Vibrio sp. Isolate24]MCG9681898.1 N-acetyltransferase [Vibrio sp. Isolate23]